MKISIFEWVCMPWVETIDLEVGSKSLESGFIDEEEMDWNKESTYGNTKLCCLEENLVFMIDWLKEV